MNDSKMIKDLKSLKTTQCLIVFSILSCVAGQILLIEILYDTSKHIGEILIASLCMLGLIIFALTYTNEYIKLLIKIKLNENIIEV